MVPEGNKRKHRLGEDERNSKTTLGLLESDESGDEIETPENKKNHNSGISNRERSGKGRDGMRRS